MCAMDQRTPRPRVTGSDSLDETCGICGGDRRIANSFGLTTTCPSCHGTGRRLETSGFRDVTKTKASHHMPATKSEVIAKAQWPTTHAGEQLAIEVRDSATCTSTEKAKLIREIIDYEGSHGQCTQTFIKKVRKQIRPRTSP
jgi:DnaJ-class molecular chaperone